MQLLTFAAPLKRQPQSKMLLTSIQRMENYDSVRSLIHTHSNPTQFAGTKILRGIDYHTPFMITRAANRMQTSFIEKTN
jgi:hypothetical protein